MDFWSSQEEHRIENFIGVATSGTSYTTAGSYVISNCNAVGPISQGCFLKVSVGDGDIVKLSCTDSIFTDFTSEYDGSIIYCRANFYVHSIHT